MSINDANYPATIWDGDSPNTQRINRDTNQAPGYEDWDQIVSELIATQIELDSKAADIATNTADIATNTSAIAALGAPDKGDDHALGAA